MNRLRQFASRGLFCSLGLATFTLIACPRAGAVICSSPSLPPECGEFSHGDNPFLVFTNPGGGILETVQQDTILGNLTNPVITPLAGGDELEEFDARMTGDVTAMLPFGGSTLTVTFPYELNGPMQVVTSGKTGNQTGTFQTEMISMSLEGTVNAFNIRIRESPTIASLGEVTITDIGGGQFEIESFFDIFTEVSVDGGAWVPADSNEIITLIPEPSAGMLTLLGLLGLVARRRRA